MNRTAVMFNIKYDIKKMFTYIETNKPPYTNLKVKPLLSVELYNKCWGFTYELHSAYDVLQNPGKYKDDMDRINNVDISYPIIVCKNRIVDGMHRLLYCHLNKIEYIKAYIFTYDGMKQFDMGIYNPNLKPVSLRVGFTNLYNYFLKSIVQYIIHVFYNR